jgi:hypothetical protein
MGDAPTLQRNVIAEAASARKPEPIAPAPVAADAGGLDVDISEAVPPAEPPAAQPMVRPNQPAPTVMFESSVHGNSPLANLERLGSEAEPPASSQPAEEPEPPAEPSPRPIPARGKLKGKPLPRKGVKPRAGFATSRRDDDAEAPAPKASGSKAGLFVFLGLVLCGAVVIGVILLRGKGQRETAGQEETAPAAKSKPLIEPVPAPSEAPAALAPTPAAAEFVPPTPPPAEKPAAVEKPSRAEKPAHAEKPKAEPASAPPEPKPTGGKPSEENFRRANEAYQRGNTKLFAGNTAEAIAEFNQAVKFNPRDPANHRGLGLAYAQAGKSAEAIRQLKLYLKTAPKANDRAMIEKKIDQLKGQ